MSETIENAESLLAWGLRRANSVGVRYGTTFVAYSENDVQELRDALVAVVEEAKALERELGRLRTGWRGKFAMLGLGRDKQAE